MIRSVDSLASFNNFRSVGKVISAGMQEASMVSVPQFLPSDQSTGFTSSSSESCLPASTSGSSESSSFESDATASSTICLPCSAISLLIRMRSSSESRYYSRWLRLAEMYHHRWVKRCLAGIAGKPRQICKSAFSQICSTVSSSVKPSRCLMNSAPNARLTGFAEAPVVGLN